MNENDFSPSLVELPQEVLRKTMKRILYDGSGDGEENLKNLLRSNSRFVAVFNRCRRQILRKWLAALLIQRKFKAYIYGGLDLYACQPRIEQTMMWDMFVAKKTRSYAPRAKDFSTTLDMTRISNRFYNIQAQVCTEHSAISVEPFCMTFALPKNCDIIRWIRLPVIENNPVVRADLELVSTTLKLEDGTILGSSETLRRTFVRPKRHIFVHLPVMLVFFGPKVFLRVWFQFPFAPIGPTDCKISVREVYISSDYRDYMHEFTFAAKVLCPFFTLTNGIAKLTHRVSESDSDTLTDDF